MLTWCLKINTISLFCLLLDFQPGGSSFLDDYTNLLDEIPKNACRELEKLNVSSFMHVVQQATMFNFPCETFRDVDQTLCPGKYELVLTRGECFNRMEISPGVDFYATGASNLKAKSKNLTILFEFEFNRTAEEAFNRLQKYVSAFYFENRDILCIGVNYSWEREEMNSRDLFVCEWIAELLSANGGSKGRSFPKEGISYVCPLYEDQDRMVLGPKELWPRTKINYQNT